MKVRIAPIGSHWKKHIEQKYTKPYTALIIVQAKPDTLSIAFRGNKFSIRRLKAITSFPSDNKYHLTNGN